LEDILQPMNQHSNGQSYNMRLGQFVDDIYFPYVGRQKHKSTEIGYREKWRNYIKPLVLISGCVMFGLTMYSRCSITLQKGTT